MRLSAQTRHAWRKNLSRSTKRNMVAKQKQKTAVAVLGYDVSLAVNLDALRLSIAGRVMALKRNPNQACGGIILKL